MSSTKRIVITGMGTVNPLGHNVADTWSALLACRSGVAATRQFDAAMFPSMFSAEVKDFDLARHLAGAGDDAEASAEAQAQAKKHQHAGRHCRFAIGAAAEA